jgi:N-acyl-D-amino-acid deacylase
VEAAGSWDGIVLSNAQHPDHARFEGQTIAAIAKARGTDPADTAFDLVAQGRGRVMAIFHMMSEPDLETALRFPWTSIGSDAGAAVRDGGQDPTGLTHPRAYGNFPRLIARYVRDQRVLSLEAAIRKMTSWPATRMRLAGRGVLSAGAWADVVVFDYDTLADTATYEAPTQAPTGIDYVLVNGQIVIDHGRHTGARSGQVVYGPGRSTTAAIP